MAEKFEKLFDQFAPVTPEEWRAKAEVDLKGADYNKRMIWRTNEGFNVEPLYRGVDIENLKTTESLPGEYPFVRGTRVSNDWYVRQDIDVTDVKAANAKALEILNKGINNVGFNLPHGQNRVSRPGGRSAGQGADAAPGHLRAGRSLLRPSGGTHVVSRGR